LKIRKKKEKSNIPPPPFAFHFSPILGMTKSLSGVRTSQKKKNGKIKKRNFFSLFALHADELKKDRILSSVSANWEVPLDKFAADFPTRTKQRRFRDRRQKNVFFDASCVFTTMKRN
jgi:hypothetical protein